MNPQAKEKQAQSVLQNLALVRLAGQLHRHASVTLFFFCALSFNFLNGFFMRPYRSEGWEPNELDNNVSENWDAPNKNTAFRPHFVYKNVMVLFLARIQPVL